MVEKNWHITEHSSYTNKKRCLQEEQQRVSIRWHNGGHSLAIWSVDDDRTVYCASELYISSSSIRNKACKNSLS